MSNRLAILLLVGLGGLAVVLLWVGLDEGPSDRRTVSASAPGSANAPGAPVLRDEPLEIATPPTPAAEPEPTPVDSLAVTETVTREAALTAYERELSEGHWVEGNVVLPPGTPADEAVFVVARGRRLEHGEHHRAPVDSTGAFRVAFSRKTRKGRLRLEGRYVYLESSVRVKVREAEHVVLRPLLGGRIHGRIVMPEDCPIDPQTLVGETVQLGGYGDTAVSRATQISADLTYELGGLPSGEYRVFFQPERLQAASADQVNVKGGESVARDLTLHVGASLSGTVVSETGEGIAEAQVQTRTDGRGMGAWRRTKTEADGTFELEGIASGKVTLSVEKHGFEPLEVELGRLEDRSREQGREYVLARGLGISGRVTWLDGTPAQGVQVLAHKRREGRWSSPASTTWKTEVDGSFRISGLEEGAYTIVAQGKRAEEGSRKKNRLQATTRNVAAGTTQLELVLGAGLQLRGRVVDDRGAPLDRFLVRARREASHTGFRSVPTGDQLSRSFRDTDGAFELGGFDTGKWIVQATAPGHGDSEEVGIDLSDAPDALLLVCGRTGTLRGVVRSMAGAPVAEATVTVNPAETMDFFSGAERHVRTDANGAFELDRIDPGKNALTARAEGHAKSEPLLIEMLPGELVPGIELRLRAGGRLIVQAAGGSREVRVWGEDHATARTDESGHAEIGDLPPGRYSIRASPTAEEVLAFGGSSEDDDGFDVLGLRKHGVEVAEGETVHVVLERPAMSPIRVSGRVLAGGEPLEEAYLWISGKEGASSSARPDAGGEYSLLLPGPGEYRVSVRSQEGLSYSEVVHVPDVQTFELDLDVAVGSISGRAFDQHGKPAAGVHVSAKAEVESRGRGNRASAMTDDVGFYEMDVVPVGTYTVQAGGPQSGWRSRGAVHGLASAPGVTVTAGRTTRGVDLRMKAAGRLRGTILSEEGAAAQAVLIECDASGADIDQIGWSRDFGQFDIGGLSPGTIYVRARSAELSSDVVTVDIRADEETYIELVLRPAGRLTVVITEAKGPNDPSVQVRDQDGRIQPGRKRDAARWVFASLAPGRYTVTVTDGEEERVTEVEVTPAEPAKVEVRFED